MMDIETPGSSRHLLDNRNIFESFANDNTDEDDDFPDIAHVSDDSELFRMKL